MVFKVYLSGPISGLTYEQSIGWTDYAKTELAKDGIDGYKPLRGKKFLKDVGQIGEYVSVDHWMSTPKAILERDSYDVRSSDVILVNLLGAKTRSLGTTSEIGMAYVLNKPIVLVMEKSGNCHDHPFITEPPKWWVDNLDIGISIVKSILLPGV